MRLLRTLPLFAYAVVLLSIVGVSVAARSPALLLVAGVLAVLSWYVTEGPRGRTLPNWTANVLIVAVSLNVVADLLLHHENVLGVLGRFVVMLVLIKLYQRKSPRDWAQLLGLSLLLMLVGALQTNSLPFAVTLALYAILGLYVLLLFQLWAAHERHRGERLAAAPNPRLLPSPAPIVGRRTALHLRGLMVAIAGAGLVTSVLMFVLFPRGVGEGLIRLQADNRLTGYTDDIDLVGGTRINVSRRVVMTVRIAEGPGAVAEPLRLRGTALDQYDGRGRWRRATLSRRHKITTDPPELAELALGVGDTRPSFTQEIELLVPSRTLFALSTPISVTTDHPRQLRYDPRYQVLDDPDVGRLQRYAVRSAPAAPDEVLDRLAGRAGEPNGLSLVRQFEDFVEARRLAREVLVEAVVPDRPPADVELRWAWHLTAAEALTRYFHAGDFQYTLDLRDVTLADPANPANLNGDVQDPIRQFLFETRRGHCEYFASALAALCNSVGVPTRLVSGYVTMEYDDRAGLYIVRESNAHAWVEVLVGPDRWRAFDPTPAQAMVDVHGTPPSRADRWRWVFDRFEAQWTNNFVAFDGGSQQQLLRQMDSGWSDRLYGALAATREFMARVNRAFYMGPAGYIWMGIVALALIIAAVAVITRLRRKARLRAAVQLGPAKGPTQSSMLRQLGFYLDMLDVLDQAGHAKPDWQPPLYFARRLRRRHHDTGLVVRRLVELFYAVRYGGRKLDAEETAETKTLLDKLRTQIALL